MKNKFKYILTILLVSFAFVGNVFASEIIITSVVDNTVVSKSSEVSVLVNLKATEAIKECKFKFESDDTLEFVSRSNLVNEWSVSEDGVDGVRIVNGSWESGPVIDGQNIASVKYRVNDNGILTIKTVECISATKTYQHKDVKVNFTVVEDVKDTTLKSLKVINGVMNPSNVSTNHEGNYIITLNSSKFGLEMVANDSKYQDDIVVTDVNGKVVEDVSNMTFTDPTNQGQMPLTVIVGGETKYSLLVTYVQKDLDNSLSSIVINGVSLAIEKGVYDYKYTVGADVTEIVVAAVIADTENFKFGVSSNAPDTFAIKDSVSVIIVVEPKDSSVGAESVVYNVEVVKESKQEENNNKVTTGSGNNNGSNSNNEINKNPSTADIPMVLMAFILVVSLIGSVFLYRKNLENYN